MTTMGRQWFDALDHETQADYAEPPPDGPYCVLCDERETAAAPLVATRWGADARGVRRQ